MAAKNALARGPEATSTGTPVGRFAVVDDMGEHVGLDVKGAGQIFPERGIAARAPASSDHEVAGLVVPVRVKQRYRGLRASKEAD